jgi:hypothetical protein
MDIAVRLRYRDMPSALQKIFVTFDIEEKNFNDRQLINSNFRLQVVELVFTFVLAK